MFQSNLFQGKTVLVTGGGSGIGYEMARQFLTLGAEVWIASRNEARLQAASQTLAHFGVCQWHLCDIRQPESIEALAQAIQKQGKPLDILINNAGGQFRAAAEEISSRGWLAVINNNLNGTWFMTRTLADYFFIPQKQGIIVNIIAQMFRGFPGMVHTGAARAGVDNMTKTLAVEWSKFGIRVNAVAPGLIHSSGLDTYPEPFRTQTLVEFPKRIPQNRMGTAEEVAYAVLFLASPMATYITGETLYVDGGQRLWGDFWDLPSER
ncbi:MAG: SDR family oxidoreductase [Microscillaceae bacterium]|nr:SDR family oxidoreductase [Microscillaceae bacterium]